MKHNLRTWILCAAAAVFGLIITTLLFVKFFTSPMDATFHWVSFDGVETWGTRTSILPLAIVGALVTVVLGTVSGVSVVKQKESRALATAAVLASFALLLLLAGLRFL